MRAIIACTIVLLAATSAPAAMSCLGDCNRDGEVTVDELLTGIQIALSVESVAACAAYAPEPVDVTTVVAAIRRALEGCPADPCAEVDPFDDHARTCLASEDELFAFAASEQGRAAVKFNITSFRDWRHRGMRYLDSGFYDLHDEWYWFRLLNGQSVPGDTTPAVAGLRFDSIDEVYQWARREAALPLDLEFVGARLGSLRFYRLSLEDPRSFGIGTLLHVPAGDNPDRPARWLFELEYEDAPEFATLKVFFEMLAASLPADLGGALKWLVRSPSQEALAQRMEREHLVYADRLVRLAELGASGKVEVYSEGVAAGRLAFVTLADGSLDLVDPATVIALDLVPDSIPAVAAVLSATPQVPLAHVSLLARSRGTPDAYVEGLFVDPLLRKLAAENALVAVRTTQPDGFEIARISADEYDEWTRLSAAIPALVPQLDLDRLPYVIALDALGPVDADRVRPMIGGKATGELFLRAAAGVTSPDLPLAVTIRAYAEHIASLRPALAAMLADESFMSAVPIRYLVLEGPTKYDARYRGGMDAERKLGFLATHPEGDAVGDLVRAGGVKNAIEALPIAPTTLATLRSALEARFADFDVTQGIRFRSSSTVEDVEGFTGAGLYDSNTGFLDAAAQASSSDRKKTIESAIRKTWSSYWNFEAFEERRLAAIDHLSGNMGLLVHARADDAKERANGVLTLSRYRVDGGERVVLDVNVQVGATSVTNPQPGDGQPEVDRVRREIGDGVPVIERIQSSSKVDAGVRVFSDAQLLTLLAQAEEVADRWQQQRNVEWSGAQAWRGVTLDFETRWMAAGWPALRPGLPAHGDRLLLKQVRSLDPGSRGIAMSVVALPIPRDVLVRARRVEELICGDDTIEVRVLRVLTDPLLAPDLGYSEISYVAAARARFLADVPGLGVSSGDEVGGDHTQFTAVESSPAGAEALTSVSFAAARIETRPPRSYRVVIGHGEVYGDHAECRTEVMHGTANDFLGRVIDGSR